MSAQKLNTLIDAWVANPGDDTKKALVAFMDTEEYTNLDYNTRNERFITSSKIKLLEVCELFARYKYEDRIDTGLDVSEALTIGSALDCLKTYGEEAYRDKYAVMDNRVSDIDAAISEAEAKREEGLNDVKKDGTLSARGAKTVASADAKISFLKSVIGKTQLTAGQGDLIRQMAKECELHPLFPKKFKKRNVLWLAFGKYPCKAELDHFDPERGIVDLKTCANIESFRAMNYLLQMAFYYNGLLEEDMMKYHAELCVVDKHTWSRSHVWRFLPATLDAAQGTVNRLIMRYAECRETGIWRNPDPDTQEGLELLWQSEFWPHCPLSRTSKPTEL